MKITRREAIIGTLVGLTLPSVSKANISQSPFLKVFDDKAEITRIDYFTNIHDDPPPPDLIQLDKFYADRAVTFQVTSADGVPVKSVAEAEDILLRNLPDPCATWYPQIGPPPIFIGEPATPLSILVNRGCNFIHFLTKLVRGDTLLLSPKALKEGLYPSDCFQPMAEQIIGRWRQVGHLHNTVRVFVGEHLPDDQVFVIGTKDNNHALLIQSDNGLHLVREQGGDRIGPDSIAFFFNIAMRY